MSVSFADIEAAATRLAGHAVVTPLIESPALNERISARVLIKPETLQRIGAFKFRGAYNRLVQLSADERQRGVVAFSSGNHAQGVALAARMLGMPALIVMPSDAPAIKVAATKGYGAQVRLYDRLTESREAIAAEIARERGAVLVPAFDDPHIVAGQGTVGLEMIRQAKGLGAGLDVALAPVSGGGLLAGICLAMKALSPATSIWGVEPAGFEDLRLSLEAGERVSVKVPGRCLCDALESPAPGEITFPILKQSLAGAAAVTDAEVAEAMRYAFTTLKLVVEPGGSVGLAALLAGKIKPPAGSTVGLVLSGGNVDPDLFARIVKGEL
ncbi:threonine ammonia-lyase [Phenylobacterium soli]|uniref:Pyridoxal-5'-phosphate-dependent protein n=1 Tax=Phenylobacterium soli TaxID=2170551 RepID=A0A328AEG3_9CAUL|nr:threonine/serine dehydratase [Phenylobacterium soli]RAK53070.1 pyridoxal-5'-phosphate-dependent protein [Phenylobacterium soli]